MLRRMEDWMVRRIDLLITVGETFRQYFQQSGARKVVVVGNWKRLELFRRSPEENQALRRRLGIPDGALVVTCISHLSGDRKIEELLRAVHELPDVYAIVGGDGEMRSLVERWAGNNQRIIYLGFVPAAKIPAYTCASDVIYSGYDPSHPYSRYRSPHKLFEALAAGKPVIASDSGDSGEIVRAGRCGIVLPTSYYARDVCAALQTLRNPDVWRMYAQNSYFLAQTQINWAKSEVVLYREYSRLRQNLHLPPVQLRRKEV